MSLAITVADDATSRPVKFRKAGGSFAITIPVSMADAAHITEGAVRDIVVAEDGSLVIRSTAQRKKRYKLHELLQEMPAHHDLTDEQSAWEQMKPVGNEI